jgi:hypothetical protein
VLGVTLSELDAIRFAVPVIIVPALGYEMITDGGVLSTTVVYVGDTLTFPEVSVAFI